MILPGLAYGPGRVCLVFVRIDRIRRERPRLEQEDMTSVRRRFCCASEECKILPHIRISRCPYLMLA